MSVIVWCILSIKNLGSSMEYTLFLIPEHNFNDFLAKSVSVYRE